MSPHDKHYCLYLYYTQVIKKINRKTQKHYGSCKTLQRKHGKKIDFSVKVWYYIVKVENDIHNNGKGYG